MHKDIAVALIAFCGVALTATLGYLGAREQRRRRLQAESEMGFQQSALSFSDFVSEWAEIEAELHALVEASLIDRFLILRAWNGSHNPRWTTAVFQYRQGDQEPVSYIHFELDDDYVQRLNHIVSNGSMMLEVSRLPESAIKSIYEAEGVKHSLWFFLGRKQLESNAACQAITYCSFATHDDEPITGATVTRCRILASRMKSLAAT